MVIMKGCAETEISLGLKAQTLLFRFVVSTTNQSNGVWA